MLNLHIFDNHLFQHTDEKINMTIKVCYFMFSLRLKVFPRWPFYASARGQRSEFTIEQLLSTGVFLKEVRYILRWDLYVNEFESGRESSFRGSCTLFGRDHSQKEIFLFHSIMMDKSKDASSEELFCNTLWASLLIVAFPPLIRQEDAWYKGAK